MLKSNLREYANNFRRNQMSYYTGNKSCRFGNKKRITKNKAIKCNGLTSIQMFLLI